MPTSRNASILRKNLLLVLLILFTPGVMGRAQSAHSAQAQSVRLVTAGHPHILRTKQYHANHAFDVLPLEYHTGPVMRATSTSYAIFWLPSSLQDGGATSVSATYVSLIRRYFGDIGGSGLYNTATHIMILAVLL